MAVINYTNLAAGTRIEIPPTEVSDALTALLSGWLDRLITEQVEAPLPFPELSHYSAVASAEGDNLLVTVCAPAGLYAVGRPFKGRTIGLVHFGVSSAGSAELWKILVDDCATCPDAGEPDSPWIGVVMLPGLIGHRDGASWLINFEQTVGSVWVAGRRRSG